MTCKFNLEESAIYRELWAARGDSKESSEDGTSSKEEMTTHTYAVNVALFKSKLKDNLFRKVAQVQDAWRAGKRFRKGWPPKERKEDVEDSHNIKWLHSGGSGWESDAVCEDSLRRFIQTEA